MKEATGEGSMTIVTIVIIVALAAAAVVVIATVAGKAKSTANTADGGYNVSDKTQNKINELLTD